MSEENFTYSQILDKQRKLVMITGKPLENVGDGFIRLVTALKSLSEKYTEFDFVYPMCLNPNMCKPIHDVHGEDLIRSNFFFIEQLYPL